MAKLCAAHKRARERGQAGVVVDGRVAVDSDGSYEDEDESEDEDDDEDDDAHLEDP